MPKNVSRAVNAAARSRKVTCQHCGRVVSPRPEDFRGLPDQDYCPSCGGVIMTYYNRHKVRPFFCYPKEEWDKMPTWVQHYSRIKPWLPSILVALCIVLMVVFIFVYNR